MAYRGTVILARPHAPWPRGAPPTKVNVQKLVELTTQSKPEAATHWSTRNMGAVLGVSASTVMRHWQANGLKPHIVRGSKVSRDPKFVEKLEDIVGLYMSPPEHVYKSRWQVELFFKWIKQHLRIKKFLGNSENAVKTQIWCAIATYALIAIVKKGVAPQSLALHLFTDFVDLRFRENPDFMRLARRRLRCRPTIPV